MEILSERVRTLMGVVMIKFAASFMLTWGSISIYIFSYIIHQSEKPNFLNERVNNELILIGNIVTSVGTLLSNKVCQILGERLTLQICSYVWLASFVMMAFKINLIILIIGIALLLSFCYGVLIVSAYKCAYSHFQNSKNMVSGIILCSLALGTILWSLLFTALANPQNITPDVNFPNSQLVFFSEQVANQAPLCLKVVGFATSFLFLVGGMLVQFNEDARENLHEASDEGVVPESLYRSSHMSYRSLFLDPVFLGIFIISVIGSSFQLFIMLNAKTIFMPIINNDHLISLGTILISFVGSGAALIWGFLGDRFNYGYTIFLYWFLDFLAKLYCSFIKGPISFIVGMSAIGATNYGIVIIFGPLLVDRFGLENASKLLPFKGLALVGSAGLVFLLRLALPNIQWNHFLFLLVCITFLQVFILIALMRKLNSIKQSARLVREQEQSVNDM